MKFIKNNWITIVVIIIAIVVVRDRALKQKIEDILEVEKKVKSELII